jgi:type VI secretion system protein ImpL
MSAFMEKLRRGGWVVLLGALLVVALVWFGGPYLGIAGRQPLAGVMARVVTVLALALLVVAVYVARRALAQRRARRMAAALDDDDRVQRAAGERRQLESRFQEALQMLRQRRGANLYSLPWYAVIGPPGSGKTTLLQHSGLHFPLAGRFGNESVRGVGGTRQCDWWFTDEAVFLDTAGRYTTQDSDRMVDAGGWQDFLRLLRKHRPRRPLNGVVVTMSLSDLLTLDPGERLEHAQAIRRRLDELHNQLHLQVPVYLVLTKCDLLAGFSEFFDDLDGDQRAQVWGVSFPLEKSLDGSAPAALAGEFARLLDRLNARVLQRLHDEREGSRRAAVLAFPPQFAAAAETARQFTSAVFSGQSLAPAPLLRGVYLTSGTQEGTPIDRMLGAVARSFGLDAQQTPAPTAQPKTYFVQTLLRSVVLSESGLAGFNPRHQRRRTLLHAAACVAVALVAGVWVAAMFGSYHGNAAYLAQVEQALEARPHTEDPSQGNDLREYYARAIQRLQATEAVAKVAAPAASVPWSQRWGLYQGNAIGAEMEQARTRELNALLVPGLAAQLRRGLQQSATEPQALYYYLKGYLMLGETQHLQADDLRALVELDAQRLFDGDPVLVKALDAQLARLVDRPGQLRAISPEPLLVEQARNTLRSANLATLVYSNLKLGARAMPGAPLRLDRALGLLADVFQRRSGTALSTPWPALYTQPVFAELAASGIDEAVERFVSDDWVLGRQRMDAMVRARLSNEVLRLYEQDYIRAWDGLLADLQLAPDADPDGASSTLAKISGPSSPLRLLLGLVREQTQDLTRAPPASAADKAAGVAADKGEAAAGKLAAQAAGRVPGGNAALKAALAPAADQLPAVEPGAAISEHFAALNQLCAGAPGSTPLDAVLATFDQLGRQLLAPAPGTAAVASNEALLLARQQAAQLPPPVSGWLLALSGQGSAQLNRQSQAALDDKVARSISQVCAEFVRGRYPFDPAATAEIPVQNFAELFGYGGRFDALYQQALEPLLDTAGQRWQWKDPTTVAAADPALPARMQLADAIKHKYFRNGAQPEVGFTVFAPVLAEGVARLAIDIDGQHYDYQEGAPPNMPMKWPGPTPGRVTIAAFDAAGKRLGGVAYLGDWALFRALQAGKLALQSDLRYVATFDLEGIPAQLPLQASNLRHPFGDTDVARFRCGS